MIVLRLLLPNPVRERATLPLVLVWFPISCYTTAWDEFGRPIEYMLQNKNPETSKVTRRINGANKHEVAW